MLQINFLGCENGADLIINLLLSTRTTENIINQLINQLVRRNALRTNNYCIAVYIVELWQYNTTSGPFKINIFDSA